ncbi:MAG: RNA polymerase sigma factor [Fimbriiglobus sp.]
MLATSRTLLERLKEPDSPAWPRFVSLYTPLIQYWAKQLGLRTEDSSDLVQDVLTIAVRRLPTFEYQSGQSFRGWLRTVTRNSWKRQRLSTTPVSFGEMADFADPDWDELTPEEDREHARILVRRGLEMIRGEFSKVSWEAFELHVLQCQSALDVAKSLGLQVGTIYAAKSRILARLREVLGDLVELEEISPNSTRVSPNNGY